MRITETQERKLLLGAWCRRVALLLELQAPVEAAVEITSQSIGALAEVMLPLCARVRRGESISDAMSHSPEDFPSFVRAAILAGEETGHLARALRGVAECLQAERLLDLRPASISLAEADTEPPAITFTRELLLRAVREEATEVHLAAEEGGLTLRMRRAGHWEPVEQVERVEAESVFRRLLLMADIPYWVRDPAVGTVHVHMGERDWAVGVRAIPGGEGGWERLELGLRPLGGGEDETA